MSFSVFQATTFSDFFFPWRYNPLWVCIFQPSSGAIASSRTRFLDHTQRRATVGRTPLDEWSARRRDLYLTTHNTHNRQTSMPPVEFEPTISAGERPKTYALDRAATGTGLSQRFTRQNSIHITFSYLPNYLLYFTTLRLLGGLWTGYIA